MAAMRSDLGTHELPLGPPKELPDTVSGRSYRFTITQGSGRIQVGMEFYLRMKCASFRLKFYLLQKTHSRYNVKMSSNSMPRDTP